MKYIDKDALVAEIERRIDELYDLLPDASKVENGSITMSETCNTGKYTALESFRSFVDTLEVKEVDLDKEITRYFKDWGNNEIHCFAMMQDGTSVGVDDCIDIAKHFFELGLNASNPIAEVNLESLVRQVKDLSLEAGKHYDSIIKEERKKSGGSDLAINLLCGTIDAQELCIQYVLDKLKAHKGGIV